MLKRVVGFTYAAVCYVIFLAAFLCAIGFVGGGNLYSPEQRLVAPWAIDIPTRPLGDSLAMRFLIDAVLLSLFAVQHSVMARQWFKQRWTQMVAPLLERSTFVLLASLILLLMYWQWRPIGTSPERVVWDVHNHTARLVLQGLFWLGWLIVLTSTFLIDHFDLFGLKQATCYLKGGEMPAPTFRTPGFYRGVRHPIYLGFIIAFWSTPRMSLGHLFFAVMTTGYILVAIQFEERDLLRMFGDRYADYRKQVSMLTPVRFLRARPSGEEVKQKGASS